MRTIILLVIASAAAGCSHVTEAPRVATGLASELVCGDHFVSGLPVQRSHDELVATMPGMGVAAGLLGYRVDEPSRSVEVRIAGLFPSRSVYREGLGCVLGAEPPDAEQPTATPAAPLQAAPRDERLEAAVQRAFDAPGQRTRAIVVLRDGRLAAERYATGIGPDTPLLGFSMSKSVASALAGVLVQQGRLSIDRPAPVAAWQDDARRAITVDQLLRQVSGLDLLQDNTGFDFTSRVMFTLPDKAAACAQASAKSAPGSDWNYSDCHYMLLSRVLRDAAGGSAADVLKLARQGLFDPVGMRHVAWDFDPSGTPNGAAGLRASARDWARFGQLYLDDGMAGGRRVLPEGWVRYSTTPTGDNGYGAGWWLQHEGRVQAWGIPWGLPGVPADAYFARGYRGQFTVVVPSARLVVVRLAAADMTWQHVEVMARLVAEAAALYSRDANASAKR